MLSGQNFLWKSHTGSVFFSSDAPLELIEARSDELVGIINPIERTFAFAVKMKSFEGFNSALQHEHFNENYMESSTFPKGIFSGRIIEKIDLTKDGDYNIRAKGMLILHGVKKERIIKSTVHVEGNQLTIHSKFTALLIDHDITIPRLVYQKIAEEIEVEINAVFEKNSKS